MKTIPLDHQYNQVHNNLRYRTDGADFAWDPYPVAAIDIWGCPLNMECARLRHPAPRQDEAFWMRSNTNFDRQCRSAISLFVTLADLDSPGDAGRRTILVEAAPFGCFVWPEDRTDDAVLLLRRREMTAHERLVIVADFLERRERLGEGVDTPGGIVGGTVGR